VADNAAFDILRNDMNRSSLVYLFGDDQHLSPAEITAELARLCAEQVPAPDVYGLGGVVEEVEAFFARQLGKERALFMPTGTLANQLAIRALAGERRRVMVQDVSHVYNDTGDASQTLSNLTLLPLAPGNATFTWEQVEEALRRTDSGRVAAPVGAISIESPVRRLAGELFDRSQMTDICNLARKQGIRTHLDGARLYIAAAYSGISPADYAAPFDTVYVSLWKYFNSLNGAILAGPKNVLDGMFHTRRMFGGALFNAWPFALLARHYANGYLDHMKSAIAVSEEFIQSIQGNGFRVERVDNGTNIFRLVAPGKTAGRMSERLAAEGVALPTPGQRGSDAVFWLQVNETWNRTTGSRLADQFKKTLR
jgi:threonine aldolase